jgi:hypothetical protein
LQHVQLAEIQSTDEPQSTPGTEDGAYEQAGYEILAFGRRGPLILQKMSGSNVAFYLLFHSDRSTLPYRVAFPILVSNFVEIALQQSSLSEVRAFASGVLPPLPMERSTEYQVSGPGGFQMTASSDDAALLSGIPVGKVGEYKFSSSGEEKKTIGVGLLDSRETALKSAKEIRIPEDLTVAAATETVRTDRPLWPMFALLGFFALIVEWWYFHRRPGGLPAR